LLAETNTAYKLTPLKSGGIVGPVRVDARQIASGELMAAFRRIFAASLASGEGLESAHIAAAPIGDPPQLCSWLRTVPGPGGGQLFDGFVATTGWFLGGSANPNFSARTRAYCAEIPEPSG
jgi:hypothetical protein